MNNLIIDIKDVNNFSKYKRLLTDELLKLGNKYRIIHPTHKWLAKKIGCSREWVSKLTTALHLEGFITKTSRFKTSCLYTLSSSFDVFEVRQSLKHLLPALGWIPMSVGMLINAQPIKSSHYIFKGKISNSSFEEKNEKEVRTMSEVCKRIVEKLSLNAYQQEQLNSYPENIVLEAERILAKSTEIENKPGYLFGILRKKMQTTSPFSQKTQHNNYVSDNKHRSNNTNTQSSPIHKVFVAQVDSPESRKVKMLETQAYNKRTQDRIATLYGQSQKEAKTLATWQTLPNLLASFITTQQPIIEPIEITVVDNDEDSWWSMQQPEDMVESDIEWL